MKRWVSGATCARSTAAHLVREVPVAGERAALGEFECEGALVQPIRAHFPEGEHAFAEHACQSMRGAIGETTRGQHSTTWDDTRVPSAPRSIRHSFM